MELTVIQDGMGLGFLVKEILHIKPKRRRYKCVPISVSENSFLFRDGSGGNILEYNVKENTTELFLESSVLVSL